MRRLLMVGAFASLLLPAAAMAQSAFDGTWKTDLSKFQMPMKPDIYVLQNGMYECKTCIPPYKIKADGTDQTITGHPYADSINIKVVDDHTILETDKKNGKVVGISTTKVSASGKSATIEFSDSSDSNGAPVTGKGTIVRVAPGPAGSHAISGSWRTSKVENVSDNGLMVTIKTEGDNLTMTTPTGQSYTAKLDGTEAPMKGDPGITKVSVKRISKVIIEETDKRDGKVISVERMTVAPDGKSISVVYTDKERDATSRSVMMKQ